MWGRQHAGLLRKVERKPKRFGDSREKWTNAVRFGWVAFNRGRTSSMHEREIILKAQRGDHEAFGELVRRYQARLRGFAARDVENSHDVYDLVQDAFLDALRNLGSFDVEREFYPWLRAICRNRAQCRSPRHSSRRWRWLWLSFRL